MCGPTHGSAPTKNHLVQFIFENKTRFFLALFGLNFILRISSLYHPFLDIDESQFAGFAHVLMDGGLPYRDSLDTKPPLIYLFYRGCFALFGTYSMLSVHLVTILWVFATAYVVYLIGKEWGSKKSGKLAALFYVLFSTAYTPKFIATSITSVMMLPLALSALMWVKGERRHVFLSGILVGLAFLFKFQAGIQIVIYFVCLFLCHSEARPKNLPSNLGGSFAVAQDDRKLIYCFLRYLLFLIGFAFPIVATCYSFYSLGVWDDFITWSLQGSAHYIQAGRQAVPFWQNLVDKGGTFFLCTLFLWVGVGRYCFHFFKDHFKTLPPQAESGWPRKGPPTARTEEHGWGGRGRVPDQRHCRPQDREHCERPPSQKMGFEILIIAWLILSFIPVFVGGRFYGHYFIQILPPACLMTALAIENGRFFSEKFKPWLKLLIILPVVICWLLRVDQNLTYRYFPDDDLEKQQKVGEWLRHNSSPNEKLFVWGFATAIYFHSHLKPASRFLWADLLTGQVPGTSFKSNIDHPGQFVRVEAWKAFWEDMQKNKPDYFVDTSTCRIHSYQNYPLEKYSELSRLIQSDYVKWETVEECVIYKKKI